jgi:PAS domain S-box-containing protein/putative nucleotidyltransferase with HDIG domain
MRPALAIAIALSGWVIAGSYVYYDYAEYGINLGAHLLSYKDFPTFLFHFFVFFAPLLSMSFGYLVNERIKLLEGIRDLELRYKDYYDNAPYGYHSANIEKVILEVNDTWLRMLGYERSEVVGKMKVTDLMTGDGLETFNRVYPILKEKGFIENVEYDFIKRDGSHLPVLLSSTAVYDEAGGFSRSRTIIKDNTEINRYEATLRTASEEWKKTFDSMPWGVMLLDREHNILRANEYLSEITGLQNNEIVSRKCYEIIHGSDSPIRGCILNSAIDGTSDEMTEHYEPTLDRYFRLYCNPVFIEGKITTFVHSLVDITDIRQGQKKLLDSRDAFFNMLKDASAYNKELEMLQGSLILAFANAIDAKSHWTKGHSERVSNYAVTLARELGLPEGDINTLRSAALLHDIGKIGTYDYLLDKPEELTPEEYDVVKRHPLKSAEILEPIRQFGPVIDIVKYHHERYDGMGYPEGLKGREIPLMARMLCLVDSYDSMTADRPYRSAPGRDFAIDEMKKCSGTYFDPELVGAFLKVLQRHF